MADSKPRNDDSATGGWSGRFGEPVADRVKRYTASVDFDRRLADADIAGSLAHARMLAAVGVLAADDLAAIERGMETIRGEIARGEFSWSRDLEDVHFNVEKRLTALVGDAGKRLHTGRSRNDQVATDLRLWLRAEIDGLVARIGTLRRGFVDLAEQHAATIMPGYTHLQVAQPVTLGHHLLAYEAMFARDAERLRDCRRRVNRLPLGSAALAGTSFPIDRAMVAKELGFEALCGNSLDAVSDRDFAVEFTAAAAVARTAESSRSATSRTASTPRAGWGPRCGPSTRSTSIPPGSRSCSSPRSSRRSARSPTAPCGRRTARRRNGSSASCASGPACRPPATA